VGAENSDRDQQEPERHGPRSNPVRPSADALDPPAGRPAPHGSARPLGHTPTLDALAHVRLFDIGPPGTGLGSSCHRGDANNASGGRFRLSRYLRQDAVRYDSPLRNVGQNFSEPVERRSVTGDGREEVGDGFGVVALIEQRRHLAEAARAAFGDRIEHERLTPRFG
jgi:hypothetical protein